jgi:peptide methionine sulfoxide reductase MsrB
MPNKKLTTEQKYVLFEHGTEKPFSSPLLKNKELMSVKTVVLNFFLQKQSLSLELDGLALILQL